MSDSSVTESLSQVASPNPNRKRLGTVFFIIIIVMMVFWTFFGGDKKETKVAKAGVKPNWQLAHSATDTKVDASTGELNDKMQQLKTKMDLEKLAQQEKLYRMRQSAPIEMYSADYSSVSTKPVTCASENQGVQSFEQTNLGNNLPLSAQQIEKLKAMTQSNDPNSQFQQNVVNTPVEVAHATRIAYPDYTITQGTLIPGVLQTAINSDLPGMVKANVSMDVYAQQGNRVLIPKGSTLIGQYNSGIAMGQRRVFILWTRLIRPDGIDVMLGSPGTDSLGQGGMDANALNTHFWTRFGQATLLSIVAAGIANVGVNGTDEYNSASEYRMAIANSFQQSAGTSLMGSINTKPTIHIHQGEKMNVFVNRDLVFYNVLTQKTQGLE